jgi:hypothetical protein
MTFTVFMLSVERGQLMIPIDFWVIAGHGHNDLDFRNHAGPFTRYFSKRPLV